MTDLTKRVKRISSGLIHQKGKTWQIVIILEPPRLIGFRLKGCQKTYFVTAEDCYWFAVKIAAANLKKKREEERKKRKAESKKL